MEEALHHQADKDQQIASLADMLIQLASHID
jgi:hypothetical protein